MKRIFHFCAVAFVITVFLFLDDVFFTMIFVVLLLVSLYVCLLCVFIFITIELKAVSNRSIILCLQQFVCFCSQLLSRPNTHACNLLSLLGPYATWTPLFTCVHPPRWRCIHLQLWLLSSIRCSCFTVQMSLRFERNNYWLLVSRTHRTCFSVGSSTFHFVVVFLC